MSFAVPSVELILLPRQKGFQGEMRVLEFPFVVSRVNPKFKEMTANGGKEAAYALSRISREHARIFFDENGFHVQDLGSLNGTYHNRRRLEANECISITDGDLLGFSEWATFVVQIPHPVPAPQPEPVAADAAITAVAVEAETLVSETEERVLAAPVPRPSERVVDKPAADVAVPPQAPEPEPAPLVGIQQMSDDAMAEGSAGATIILGEAFRAKSALNLIINPAELAQEKQSRSTSGISSSRSTRKRTANDGWRRLWREFRLTKAVLLTLFVIVLAGLGIWKAVDTPQARVQRLIEAARYQEAFSLACVELAHRPDDKLERLAIFAAIRHLVRDRGWFSLLSAGNYQEALQQAKTIAGAAPDAEQLQRLGAFLEISVQFLEQGAEVDRRGALRIYRDEDIFEDLLSRWDRAQSHHQQMAMVLRENASDCPDIFAQVNNYRARFQNYQNSFLVAMTTLKRDTARFLDASEADMLTGVYQRFESSYGDAGDRVRIDISPLQEDLARYLPFWEGLRERDPYRLVRVSADAMQTPPFREALAKRLEQAPPTDVLERYLSARQIWRDGNMADSLEQLRLLREKPWGDVAERMIVAGEEKRRAFLLLVAMPLALADENRESILHAASLFNEADDSFYRGAFRSLEAAAREHIRKDWDHARRESREAWQAYLAAGKISQNHRLSNQMDQHYLDLAKSLRVAVEATRRRQALDAFLPTAVEPTDQNLDEQIQKEAVFQWRRMDEARLLVDEAIVREKLSYLPKPAIGD